MNTHLDPESFLIDYVLSKVEGEPVDIQIYVYRCVAARTSDKALKAQATQLANDLEKAQSLQRTLRLDLQRRAQS